MQELYQKIVEILSRGEAAALVTVIDSVYSTPRRTGAKMLVQASGNITGSVGGGRIEAEAIKIALNTIRTGKAAKHRFTLTPEKELGMACGGEMEIFVEPVQQKPVMYVFGAGHIALSLVKIAIMVGFKVVIIDNRPDFANKQRFPEADDIIVGEYAKVFSKIKADNSYLIIITHNHEHDQEVLEQAVKTPAKYIGMIGSKNKVKTLFNHLIEKGIDKKVLGGVHSPIGLEINAETPEEIAISIMAEIIQVRRSSP